MNATLLTDAIRGFGTAKQVANVVGCSEATAARYRRGDTMPDALDIAKLMSRSRTILAAMLRLSDLDDLMDLEEAWLARELRRHVAKRAGRPNAEIDAAVRAATRDLLGRRG